MNIEQINAIGIEISKLQKEKEDLEKENSKILQKIVVIKRNIDNLSDGVQEARAKLYEDR